MATDHVWCHPPVEPISRGQRAKCPECGRCFFAFDYHAAYAGLNYMRDALAEIPKGALGWARDTANEDRPTS